MAGIGDDEEFQPVRRRGLRTGYTTGACATAAAAGATRTLLNGVPCHEVTIDLPAGVAATFSIERCTTSAGRAQCVVVKDAGDDPDVTHGAEIVADVWREGAPGIHLRGGSGVGVVTLPGLGLEIGGPAINPVPRRMIVEAVTAEAAGRLEPVGLTVEISVPRGEELAKKTLNARLGILGGISILGTTGIVRPFSTAAYRASVEQGIDVAVANGQRRLVFSTGGRSERFAQSVLDLPEIAFVEMGEFTGHALKRCLGLGVQRAYICGMIGKLSKLAQGHFMTHVAGNQVDPVYLAAVASRAGATAELRARIATANTARGAQELALEANLARFFSLLAEEAAASCHRFVHGAMAIDCLLFDFDGRLLGRAAVEAKR
jgi:cobalt-precorrin-5B (C1)-methyltransferase